MPKLPPPKTTQPYDFQAPSKIISLPNELIEISGLHWGKDGKIYCLEDESGKIYVVEVDSGRIEREIRFWKDGDYEGIEGVGGNLWVTNSKGTLFEIANYQSKSPPTQKFPTDLKKKNNVEGMGYWAERGWLILCLKGKSNLENVDYDEAKSLFAFDIDRKKALLNEPVLTIYRKEILTFWDSTHPGDSSLKNLRIGPSGMAIHPQTGDWYIVHAIGFLLTVYDGKTLQLKQVTPLDKAIYPQAEGLCFAPDGTLYISNEGGRDFPATIVILKD